MPVSSANLATSSCAFSSRSSSFLAASMALSGDFFYFYSSLLAFSAASFITAFSRFASSASARWFCAASSSWRFYTATFFAALTMPPYMYDETAIFFLPPTEYIFLWKYCEKAKTMFRFRHHFSPLDPYIPLSQLFPRFVQHFLPLEAVVATWRIRQRFPLSVKAKAIRC